MCVRVCVCAFPCALDVAVEQQKALELRARHLSVTAQERHCYCYCCICQAQCPRGAIALHWVNAPSHGRGVWGAYRQPAPRACTPTASASACSTDATDSHFRIPARQCAPWCIFCIAQRKACAYIRRIVSTLALLGGSKRTGVAFVQ